MTRSPILRVWNPAPLTGGPLLSVRPTDRRTGTDRTHSNRHNPGAGGGPQSLLRAAGRPIGKSSHDEFTAPVPGNCGERVKR
ncbi:hypothetical protein Mame01_54400 [Microbispora amethystogenes]|nr:hypothetical protein Mame01_54400 [Microbispora amethystogenes]